MYRPLLVGIAIFLAGGCNLTSLEDPIVIPEVSDEFYLDMWERLEPTGRYLEWKLRTIEKAECEESTLNYSYRTTSGTIELDINAIELPADCTPSEQPLQTTIEGVKLSTNYYPLQFSLRDAVTNEGALVVSTDKYEANLQDSKGIILVRRELRRIPDETIWGQVQLTNDSLKEAAAQFMDQLLQLSQPKLLAAGYYGYFMVETSGKVVLNNNETAGDIQSFTHQFRGDTEDLTELVENTRLQYPEGLTIRLYDTKGRTY